MHFAFAYSFPVLAIKAQVSLGDAEKYFREHLGTGDYYSQDKQVIGEWIGRGAERLNLSGLVRQEDFASLCRNLNPNTYELLTQRRKTLRAGVDRDGNSVTVANRRVFYDFTFSPPKSVSIAALVAGDRRIHEAERPLPYGRSLALESAGTRPLNIRQMFGNTATVPTPLGPLGLKRRNRIA